MRCNWRYLLFGSVICIAATGTWHPSTTPFPAPQPRHFPPVNGGFLSITMEAAELGRHLFHDPRLSSDGTISCASCHLQEHAFSNGGHAFSMNASGTHTRRNTMPLFNLVWYDTFGWDGRAATLEEQVIHAMHDEMASNMDEALQRVADDPIYQELYGAAYGTPTGDGSQAVHAISQFLGTLVSYQSKYDRVLVGEDRFSPDEYDGFVLVNDQSMGNCLHCHITDAHALGTSGGFGNNGLDPLYTDPGRAALSLDPKDHGRFRIPSLRNVTVTAPYMHDGRFNTLEEVLDHYSEGVHPGPHLDNRMISRPITAPLLTHDERRKIIAFLHTLTDSAFISDPAFSDPFGRP
jgi:cytochrome c peroxidase